MGITIGEVGKEFNYATSYNLQNATELTLKFTSPTGVKKTFTLTGGRVTAPAANVSDPDVGYIPGRTYMQMTTLATDFDESGMWAVCGVYEDATPIKYNGDRACFYVDTTCT